MKKDTLKKKSKQQLLKICLIVFSLASFLWLLKVLFHTSYPDFSTYYFGAVHILNGENPYLPDPRYFTHQVYPPFTMVFFIPFTLFSYEIASKVWVLLSVAAFLLTIYLLLKMYSITIRSAFSLIFITLAFLAFPLKFSLGMGQINTILLLFLTLSLYLINKKKDMAAGILMTFPLLLKFFPLLMILYMAFIKKWKFLIICLLSVLFFMTITLLFIPLPIITEYFQTTLPDLLNSRKGDYYNQSLSGFLIRTFPDETIGKVIQIIFSLILLCCTFTAILIKRNKSQQRINLEIGTLICLSVLINNFSWQHHYIFLTIPFLIAAYTLVHTKTGYKMYIVLFTSYLLTAGNLKDPSVAPLALQSHVFFGGLLLWLLLMYLLFKRGLIK